MKTISKWLAIAVLPLLLVSCGDEFGETIFPDVPVLDENAYTYEFDKWLYENYTLVYNVDFQYKLQDVGSDMNYNLVPATYEKAQQIAHLTRYLWFDVYTKMVNEDFLKYYSPRILHLIGSSAINPTQHTEKLGTAEGGIKITLYKVNAMDVTDIDQLNEYIFKTMHHEFAHILHQTKNYPIEFESISNGDYDVDGWQNRADTTAFQLGFTSPYASSQAREDFVETIANYIVKTDADWNEMLTTAARGKIDDNTTGRDILEQKLAMCKSWLTEKWSIDLDKLRSEVQRRQANLDMDMIMNDNY